MKKLNQNSINNKDFWRETYLMYRGVVWASVNVTNMDTITKHLCKDCLRKQFVPILKLLYILAWYVYGSEPTRLYMYELLLAVDAFLFV